MLPSVSADAFKCALSNFCSGVTVVTYEIAGRKAGLTVSAFCSVSLDPPLVLVCIGNRGAAAQGMATAGAFAVHILSTKQIDLGSRFGGMVPGGGDPFDGLAHSTAVTGAPILQDSLCWLDCSVDAIHEAGDHRIFVGRVVDTGAVPEGDPVLYHQRKWRTPADF